MNEIKTRLRMVDILKTMALIMIFLYHCNTILPGEWKFLTVCGDDMGNDLFFMVSGFALYSSIEKTDFKALPAWYFRRLKKILPLLVFFYLLSFLTGFYSFNDPKQLFAVFIYPTLYWFATGILVFYLLLFIIGKTCPVWARPVICVCLYVLWMIRGDSMESYYIIGFLSMLLGYMLREVLERRVLKLKFKIPLTILFFGDLLFYFAVKLMKLNGTDIMAFRPFLGLSVLYAGLFLLAAGYTGNEKLPDSRIFSYIGSLALPVYMVQCFNAGIIGFLIGQKIVFPLSFPVNFIIVWGAAIVLERAESMMIK